MGCLPSKNMVGVDEAPSTTLHNNPQERNGSVNPGEEGVATPGGSAKSRDSGFVDRNPTANFESMQKSVLPAIKSSSNSQVTSSAVQEERLSIVREEGMMIQRSLTSTAFGYSFEVIDAEDEGKEAVMRRRLPVRLAKLEGKRRIITDDEIRDKLDRAERRRMHQEQLRLDRIHALQLTNVTSANESMMASQIEAAQAAKLKSEAAAENRERLLRERRLRMRSAGRLRKPRDQIGSPDVLNHPAVQHSPRNDSNESGDVTGELLNNDYTNTQGADDDAVVDKQNNFDNDEVDHSGNNIEKNINTESLQYSNNTKNSEVVENDENGTDIFMEQSVQIGPHQSTVIVADVSQTMTETNKLSLESDNDKDQDEDDTSRQENDDIKMNNLNENNNDEQTYMRPKSPVANELVLSSSPNSFGDSSSSTSSGDSF